MGAGILGAVPLVGNVAGNILGLAAGAGESFRQYNKINEYQNLRDSFPDFDLKEFGDFSKYLATELVNQKYKDIKNLSPEDLERIAKSDLKTISNLINSGEVKEIIKDELGYKNAQDLFSNSDINNHNVLPSIAKLIVEQLLETQSSLNKNSQIKKSSNSNSTQNIEPKLEEQKVKPTNEEAAKQEPITTNKNIKISELEERFINNKPSVKQINNNISNWSENTLNQLENQNNGSSKRVNEDLKEILESCEHNKTLQNKFAISLVLGHNNKANRWQTRDDLDIERLSIACDFISSDVVKSRIIADYLLSKEPSVEEIEKLSAHVKNPQRIERAIINNLRKESDTEEKIDKFVFALNNNLLEIDIDEIAKTYVKIGLGSEDISDFCERLCPDDEKLQSELAEEISNQTKTIKENNHSSSLLEGLSKQQIQELSEIVKLLKENSSKDNSEINYDNTRKVNDVNFSRNDNSIRYR